MFNTPGYSPGINTFLQECAEVTPRCTHGVINSGWQNGWPLCAYSTLPTGFTEGCPVAIRSLLFFHPEERKDPGENYRRRETLLTPGGIREALTHGNLPNWAWWLYTPAASSVSAPWSVARLAVMDPGAWSVAVMKGC